MTEVVSSARSVVAPTSLIGRTAELVVLRRAWQRALRGERGVVFLSGEPGIGKTRLAVEFAGEVERAAGLALYGRCDEDPVVPYEPFVQALRHLALWRSTGTGEDDSALTTLSDLIGVAAPDASSRDGPEPTDPATQRLVRFEGVRSALRAATHSCPLLLVLDDLQWADADTVRLLRYLLRGSWDIPMLVLGNFRDTDLAPGHPLHALIADLHSDGTVEQIEVCALDAADVQAVAASALKRAITEEEARWLHEGSGGNPFFVQELVRLMEADGEAPLPPPLPLAVREVVTRRLSKLSPSCREVLTRASILGATADLALLRALWDGDATTLATGLGEAVNAALLVESEPQQKPGYRFAHALVQQTLYHGIPLPLRQQFHLRSARAIEARTRLPDDRPTGIATHYRKAGETASPAEALPHALAAAEAALDSYALDDAIGWWEWALELMDALGAEPRAKAALLERMAGLLDVAREQPRATGYLRRALALHEEAGSPIDIATARSRLGRALANGNLRTTDLLSARTQFEVAASVLAGVSSSRRVAALHGGWAELGVSSFRVEDLRHAETACQLSADLGWGVMETTGRIAAGMLVCHLGDLTQGLELLTRARQDARASGEVVQSGVAAFTAGIMAQRLGDPRVAIDWLRRELDEWPAPGAAAPWGIAPRLVSALADAGDLPAMRALAREHSARDEGRIEVMVERCAFAYFDGNWEGAECTEAEAAAGSAVSRGDRCSNQNLGHWLVRAYRARGEPARAIDFLEEELAAAVSAMSITQELVARAELAVLYAESGATYEAHEHVLRCRELLANGADSRGLLGKVLLAEGLLIGGHAGPEPAAAPIANAIAVFRQYSTPWLEARALEDWALMLRNARRRADAASKRREAEAIYQRIGAGTRWHDRLDVVAGTNGSRGNDLLLPDGLTPREVEVLRLVAAGRSNAEIAAALVLSVRTVERHITTVYGKTAASGRAAATAYAIRHGLIGG